VGEKQPHVGARKESHRMAVIKILCCRGLSPFFKYVQKGFPGFA